MLFFCTRHCINKILVKINIQDLKRHWHTENVCLKRLKQFAFTIKLAAIYVKVGYIKIYNKEFISYRMFLMKHNKLIHWFSLNACNLLEEIKL